MSNDPITGKERPVTWEADYRTWLPVAFHSFFEIDGKLILHQLWVTPLGEIDWRKVPTGDLNELAKTYAECQVFNESPDDSDFPKF